MLEEKQQARSAERIRALMFVFEDLSKLDPGGVQTLHARLSRRTSSALALKGANGRPARDLFFSNMSERAAKIHARGHGERWAPCKPASDVEAGPDGHGPLSPRTLAAKGEIMLSAGSGGDDELIY